MTITNEIEKISTRNYAIAVDVGGDISSSVLNSWSLLSIKYDIKYIYERFPLPHITLTAGSFTGDREQIIAMTKETMSILRTFEIVGNGLGVFARETPVIYVRWKQSKELVNLFLRFDRKFSRVWNEIADSSQAEVWLPKTTIAFFDTTYEMLSSVLKEIRQFNFEQAMKVEKISVIEYGEQYETLVETIMI